MVQESLVGYSDFAVGERGEYARMRVRIYTLSTAMVHAGFACIPTRVRVCVPQAALAVRPDHGDSGASDHIWDRPATARRDS